MAILAVLRIGPASGYEIREFCRDRLSQFWNESFGQIYPALSRLAKAGLIRRLDDDARPRAARYALTSAGRRQLQSWIAEPVVPRVVRDEIVLKLLCGTEVPAAVHLEHLASARREAGIRVEAIRRARDELRKRVAGHPDAQYWELILRAGELVLEARLCWCDEATTTLEGRKWGGR